jgi:hypothetical protein
MKQTGLCLLADINTKKTVMKNVSTNVKQTLLINLTEMFSNTEIYK